MKIELKWTEGDIRKITENIKLEVSDTWNLDLILAKIIAPSLRLFREEANRTGFPATLTAEEWDEILAKMEKSFATIATEDFLTAKEEEDVQEGIDLFATWFLHLWT